MEKYDYFTEMSNDIQEWLKENNIKEITNENYDEIYDKLWTEDSVTGNASGSYWYNKWKAEEALCHNLDLAFEACDKFGYEEDLRKIGEAQALDVIIRCYLLHQVMQFLQNKPF